MSDTEEDAPDTRLIGAALAVNFLLMLPVAVLFAIIMWGSTTFVPDASVNIVPQPNTEIAVLMGEPATVYAKQELEFTAKHNGHFNLRLHIRDEVCQSHLVQLRQGTTRSNWVMLEEESYGLTDGDGHSICALSEGNLDAELSPGTWKLFVDDRPQPVTVTIQPAA